VGTFVLPIIFFAFIFRYLIPVQQPIGNLKKVIIFLNKEYSLGNYSVLAKDKPLFYDTREEQFLPFKKHLIHREYKTCITELNKLIAKRKQFWKMEGKIYLGIVLLSLLLDLLFSRVIF
jgi:hypothetical protein